MIHQIYALKDNLANVFMAPQLFQNENVALRNFSEIINNTGIFKNNPADFELWKLGEFDDHDGVIIPNPEKMATGLSVVKGDNHGN